MLDIETIRNKLKGKNIYKIARHLGYSHVCLYRICNGQANPRYTTIKKLSNFVESDKLKYFNKK